MQPNQTKDTSTRGFLLIYVDYVLADAIQTNHADNDKFLYQGQHTLGPMKVLEDHFDNLHPIHIRLHKLTALEPDTNQSVSEFFAKFIRLANEANTKTSPKTGYCWHYFFIGGAAQLGGTSTRGWWHCPRHGARTFRELCAPAAGTNDHQTPEQRPLHRAPTQRNNSQGSSDQSKAIPTMLPKEHRGPRKSQPQHKDDTGAAGPTTSRKIGSARDRFKCGDWMRMRGLNSPFPAPGADDVHRQFGLGPPSLLEAP